MKGKSNSNSKTPLNMPVSPPASVHSLPEKSLSWVENHSPLTVIPVEALENLTEIERPVEITELRCMGAEYPANCASHAINFKQETMETEDSSEQDVILPGRNQANTQTVILFSQTFLFNILFISFSSIGGK